MDFEKVCLMFTMQEPYYGIILSSMERVPMPASRIQTAAVTRNGNVFRLIYNPEFVNSLDVPTALEILKHEIGHLCFNHFTLWDNPPANEGEKHIRNIAADLEVNSYLKKENVHGVQLYYPEDFHWDRELGTKEYYRLLIEQLKEQQQKASQNVQIPCNGGKGGKSGSSENQKQSNDESDDDANNQSSQNENDEKNDQENEQSNQNNKPNTGSGSGNGQGNEGDGEEEESKNDIPNNAFDNINEFDDHSMWPDDAEEQTTVDQIIEDMLVAAAEEVEKSGRGTIPAELVMRIEEIRNRRKPKPVADWKRYVRRYLGNEFSEFIRKSKKRESRRFPDAAGNRHRRKSNILVGIDTSGSVSMPEYLEFFGQIRTLNAVADFDVVECDAEIQHKYHFRGQPNMVVHGGGGTDFSPVINLFIENQKKYDALIYFTDGECYVPSNTPKDTLWVISSRGDKKRAPEFRTNGASVVFIPKKEQK